MVFLYRLPLGFAPPEKNNLHIDTFIIALPKLSVSVSPKQGTHPFSPAIGPRPPPGLVPMAPGPRTGLCTSRGSVWVSLAWLHPSSHGFFALEDRKGTSASEAWCRDVPSASVGFGRSVCSDLVCVTSFCLLFFWEKEDSKDFVFRNC